MSTLLSSSFSLRLMASSIVLALVPVSSALAMGKPKPPYTLPNPLRYVVVRPIQDLSGFETPNQVSTTQDQTQTAFSAILDGVATNSGLSVIQGSDVSNLDPCGQHLELWPTVTDFTVDDLTAGIQFGFNSGGPIVVSGTPQLSLSDTLTLGSVKIEFILYQCDNATNGVCTSLAASSADQTTLGNNFSFNISWSQFVVGGSFLSQTDLSNAVQSIMVGGLTKLINSPQYLAVPWVTSVLSVNADGSYTIFAGENAGIQLNQYFTISAIPVSGGQCGVAQSLACAYSSEVDNNTSVLKIYQTLSQGVGVPIVAGDIVEVGSVSCKPSAPSSQFDFLRSGKIGGAPIPLHRY